MAGYSNSFTAIDGDLITAALFSNEYTALDSAFDTAGGHKHDGTAGEGGYIPLIADSNNYTAVDIGIATIDFSVDVGSVKTTQLSIVDGAIVPTAGNDVDLGSATFGFKDAFINSTATINTLEVSGLSSLDGGIDVDNAGSVFSVDGANGNTLIAGTLGAGASTLADITLTTGATVNNIDTDGTMAGNSATALVTQSAVVTYVGDATLDGGSY